MPSDEVVQDSDAESNFSFAVTELRRAQLERSRSARAEAASGGADGGRLRTVRVRPVDHAQGFDPYNSTGSFDRSKSWARVGKR